MAFKLHWDVTAFNTTIAIILVVVIAIISNMTASGKTIRSMIASDSISENVSGPRSLPNEILIIIINAFIDEVLDEASQKPMRWSFDINMGLQKEIYFTPSIELSNHPTRRRQAILGDIASVNHSCRHLVTRRYPWLPVFKTTRNLTTRNLTRFVIRAWVCPEFDIFEPSYDVKMPAVGQYLPSHDFLRAIQKLRIRVTSEHCRLLELIGTGRTELPNLKYLILSNNHTVELPLYGPPEKPLKPKPLGMGPYYNIRNRFETRAGGALLEPLWNRGVRILVNSFTELPRHQPHEELVRMRGGGLGVKLLDCAYKYSLRQKFA